MRVCNVPWRQCTLPLGIGVNGIDDELQSIVAPVKVLYQP